MTVDEASLTEVAERVAAEAAELVREYRARLAGGGGIAVGTKSSATDVVTAADTASERLIRERLTEMRPDDVMFGEEEGGPDAAEDGAVRWVVDPIDGTVNFLYGYPAFAVSVAAQVGGVSVAAAVVEPLSGRRWTATRGRGAWLDGVPLRPSEPDRVELMLVATGFAYGTERRRSQAELVRTLLPTVRDIRRGGSAALDLCAVAAGWVDGFYEHGLARWDWAAGALIAREAGADVLLPGEAPDLGADAIFAAAPSMSGELRRLLAASGAAAV